MRNKDKGVEICPKSHDNAHKGKVPKPSSLSVTISARDTCIYLDIWPSQLALAAGAA